MPAVWFRFRAELRTRWRAWVGLGLLLGIAGGAVFTAAAGARRTQSSYARFLEASGASDFNIESFAESREQIDREYEALEHMPGVEASGRYTAIAFLQEDADGQLHQPGFLAMASDGRRFATIDRPKVLDGRAPDPERVGEALANRALAQREHLEVGDTLELLTQSEEVLAPYEEAPDPLAAIIDAFERGELAPKRVTFTITGIGLFSDEVAQDEELVEPRLLLTPALVRQVRPQELWTLTALRLRPGADLTRARAEIERITAGGGAHVGPQIDRTRQVERSVSPYATALALFALLAGLAGVLVVGQALSRQASSDAAGDPVLRALGLSGAQGTALTFLRASAVAIVGAAVAVGIGAALSPLTPIGPVRPAEPDPGVAFDAVILIPGALALMAVVVAWVSVTARWERRRQEAALVRSATGARSVSRTVESAARAGASVAVLTGLRLALQPGRGRTRVPVRTTIAGAVIAIAALVGVVTFAAGVDRFVDSPKLYGGNWDVTITGNGGYAYVGFDEETGESPVGVLDHLPGVETWSFASFGSIVVDGLGVPSIGIGPVRDSVHPTLLEGRAADADDEIVLGSGVLGRLGKAVGDTVEVEGGETSSMKRVVGRAVFPALGFDDVVGTALGDGAAFTFDGLAEVQTNVWPNAALVRLAHGSEGDAALAQLRHEFDDPNTLAVSAPVRPGEVAAYDDLRWTPLLLAGLLGVFAVGTLAHALVIATRYRRRDFAVLKTFGFTTRQISAAVAWQATTMVVIALAVALPLGIVLGRLGWQFFADRLGIGAGAVVPNTWVLALVPITMVVANLLAFVPGRLAARLRPAVVLRSE